MAVKLRGISTCTNPPNMYTTSANQNQSATLTGVRRERKVHMLKILKLVSELTILTAEMCLIRHILNHHTTIVNSTTPSRHQVTQLRIRIIGIIHQIPQTRIPGKEGNTTTDDPQQTYEINYSNLNSSHAHNKIVRLSSVLNSN